MRYILKTKCCYAFYLLLIGLILSLIPVAGNGRFPAKGNTLADTAAVVERYSGDLQMLFVYREKLKQLHPFLEFLHPVAIVEDDHFFVFDVNLQGTEYELTAVAETHMPIPEGVRAAFPLDFYGNTPACVVTGEVFDTPEGYVTIFHEFVHCHQWNTVERGLRENLPLARESMRKQDFMWEISYPFPYGDAEFENTYSDFILALDNNDADAVKTFRQKLPNLLDPFDYQYMVWQEWKEGFALFVENKMREHLGISRNMVGRRKPYNRTVFYAGGEAYITFLARENTELLTELESLFYRMKGN